MTTGYIEQAAAEKLAAQFIINNNGQWDETTSRCQCCMVVYRDSRYIEQRITKWALTIKDAYEAARDAWLEEKAAGRAL